MNRNPNCPHCGGPSLFPPGLGSSRHYTCNTKGCRVRFVPGEPVRDVCVTTARYEGCRHTGPWRLAPPPKPRRET